MTNPPDPNRPPPAFEPVPVRRRRDGWTPERQAAFIAALRESRRPTVACRSVGLSWQGAYKLYHRPDAASFRAAWDDAVRPIPIPRAPRADRGPSRTAIKRAFREARRLRRAAFGPWTVTRPTDPAEWASGEAPLVSTLLAAVEAKGHDPHG